jgi:hypothetical protein
MPLAVDLTAIMIVIASTVIVVVAVLGLFVWAAIRDGREEKTPRARRQPKMRRGG